MPSYQVSATNGLVKHQIGNAPGDLCHLAGDWLVSLDAGAAGSTWRHDDAKGQAVGQDAIDGGIKRKSLDDTAVCKRDVLGRDGVVNGSDVAHTSFT